MPTSSLTSRASKWIRGLFVLFLLIAGLIWGNDGVRSGILMREVEPVTRIPFFENRWLYAWLLLFTGFFPLVFGFLSRLKFYRVLPLVLLANLPVTLFFLVWDVYFTHLEVWGFSDVYTSGISWFGLPVEECLFFIVIPVACTFIYWSINAVMPREPFAAIERKITIALSAILAITGWIYWDHVYTSTTTLLTAAFLMFHWRYIPGGYRGRFYLAYLVSCLPFLLVNGVLTGGFTKGPVVMYNPEEYLGIRLGTIPLDDFVYSFLLLLANITIFEALLGKKRLVISSRGFPVAKH